MNKILFSLILSFSLTYIISCSVSKNKVLVHKVNIGLLDTTNGLHKPQEFSKIDLSKKTQVDTFNEIAVYKISSDEYGEVLKSSSAKIKRSIFFTSGCQGVYGAMATTKYYDSLYGDQIDNILIQSNNLGDDPKFQLARILLFENEIFYPTYIIDETIENYQDDRKRSLEFREQVCSECRGDVIGVPYTILYNQQNEVIAKGYYSKVNFDSIITSLINRPM